MTTVLSTSWGTRSTTSSISRDLARTCSAPPRTPSPPRAIAMYFGRLTASPAWLRRRGRRGVVGRPGDRGRSRSQLRASDADLDAVDAGDGVLRARAVRGSRPRRPERPLVGAGGALPEDPPPGRAHAPDSAKIHLSAAPVYYHNYLLGELTASQLSATIDREVRKGDAGSIDDRVGRFLEERFFAPGASLRWDELVERATGEPLGVEGFVSRFGVRGSGFGVRGSGFGVRGSGFGIRGSGLAARGSRLAARGSLQRSARGKIPSTLGHGECSDFCVNGHVLDFHERRGRPGGGQGSGRVATACWRGAVRTRWSGRTG
jgi:hypothetical protein